MVGYVSWMNCFFSTPLLTKKDNSSRKEGDYIT